MSKDNGQGPDALHVYNIKAVSNQTGLNADTIRAWERRYGFPRPQRTKGRHRLYTKQDIETLKWLIARREEGMSISHAIDLLHSEQESGTDPVAGGAAKVAVAPAQIIGLEGSQIDRLRQAWIAACLSFDRERATEVLERAFAQFDPEKVAIELLQKGLAEVGNGWYERKVTVQQEHFTSALSVQRLEMLIAAAAPPTRPERIIMSTAPGDYHVFGSLLLTYLLRRRGWDVIYLGADIPAGELEATVAQLRPELVIVSAQLLHTAAALKQVALTLRSKATKLAYGGQIFNNMPLLRELIPGHFLGETLGQAVERTSELIAVPAPDAVWSDPSQTYEAALENYRERRFLLDSFIWNSHFAGDIPPDHLTAINNDLAQTIEAVLKLGDTRLLSRDITWIEHLLMGYDLTRELIVDYVEAYFQAAKLHLDEAAKDIVEWLAELTLRKEERMQE